MLIGRSASRGLAALKSQTVGHPGLFVNALGPLTSSYEHGKGARE